MTLPCRPNIGDLTFFIVQRHQKEDDDSFYIDHVISISETNVTTGNVLG